MNTSEKQLRAEFEAWAQQENGYSITRQEAPWSELYEDLEVYSAWEACKWMAARAAQPAAPAVPQGWKLVPEYPTLVMGWAYVEAAQKGKTEEEAETVSFNFNGYEALLAAAPQPDEAHP